jgi:predicted ATP-grasp superfamily ATP-dependent carboligase
MEQIPVLVLEARDYWLTVNALYCLRHQKLFEIHFLGSNARSPFRFSPRIKSHHYFPKDLSDEAMLTFTRQVVEKTKARVLVPVSSVGFRFVIQHKEALQHFVRIIPLPEPWAYKIAEDKGLLAEFMAANHIPMPLTLVNLGEDLEKRLEDFTFPVLLKPRFGQSGRGEAGDPGITQFTDKAKLLEFIRRHRLENRYIIQNQVAGYVLGSNVLYGQGRLIAQTTQKAVVKSKRFGPSMGIEFIHNPKVNEVVGDLMSKLQWNGVANLDLIYDVKTKSIKVLEINPRFWLTVHGDMVRANVNFPYLACGLALNRPIELPDYRSGKYIPLLSFLKYQVAARSAEKVKFAWKEIDMRYYFTSLVSRACYFYKI